MNGVLRGLTWMTCLVYLDDIIIFTKGEIERHVVELAGVLERLRSAGLSLKLKKSTFATTSMEYLGHHLSDRGVQPAERLVKSVKEFPRPIDDTVEVKRFVHLSGYYRKLIAAFRSIVEPLTRLLKKDMKWQWSEAQKVSFERVKMLLTTRSLLLYPNFGLPFRLVKVYSWIGDCGASNNFVRLQSLARLDFEEVELPGSLLEVRLATGVVVRTEKRVVRARVSYGETKFVDELIVLDLDDKFDMVLCMPWLARHDPVIDWAKRTIVRFRSSGATEGDGPVGAARVPRGACDLPAEAARGAAASDPSAWTLTTERVVREKCEPNHKTQIRSDLRGPRSVKNELCRQLSTPKLNKNG
ncbi:unnamed protein product [Phytophthora fragariaefolia]|uniref:Unnamed protein product n=1 Tax=Phytophthora fragariaefolia TaxID=1490495 RepID=A0A9W7CZZ7_9STRA|nr:unnamed protein product [Phytophthora fragariaefolia]